MAKRLMSLALSLALLLSCVSGITLFTAAEELPAPFGQFDFTGANGATKVAASGGAVVRYIDTAEGTTPITSGTAIGTTGEYGYTVDTNNYGMYFGGKILNEVPDGTAITYAIEYYIDSETALAGDLLYIHDAVHGIVTYSNLPSRTQGVVLYSLSAAEVDEIQANAHGGDTRLRILLLGEAVGKLYIKGVKILDTQYTNAAQGAVPYAYYDFGKTTCAYYPDAVVTDAQELSWKDAEITDTFEGYRYFKLGDTAAAKSADATVNKPVYIKVYAAAGYENTTIGIDTYQVYGMTANGMQATHNDLMDAYKGDPQIVMQNGVGGVLLPESCFRNGAGPGSFRFGMTNAQKIARIEVYDVNTYCTAANADADTVAELHAAMLEKNVSVTTTGYQAPTPDAEGNTGTSVCDLCGETLRESTPIPPARVYAQLDLSEGGVNTAIQSFSVTNPDYASTQTVTGTDKTALQVSQHNNGFTFALAADQFDVEETDLMNGTELAITVEYYLPEGVDNNTRIAFKIADERTPAFYATWGGTCWDSMCVNQDAPLKRGELAIATFKVGKNVSYTAPKGQWSGAEKFDEPQTVNTLNFAKKLVSGSNVILYVWSNTNLAETPAFIKSVTVCNAAELEAGSGESDRYYVNFAGEATNPYYPEYVAPSNNGITTATDRVEWYKEDTAQQYTRFEYMYLRMPAALLTSESDFKATPVKLVIKRKEGSTVNGMTFQYQKDRTAAADKRWSEAYDVTFDENGVFETVLLDATFMNGLNGQSSIRLRDVMYVQSGDAENGFTYEMQVGDELSGIAKIEVYDLRRECAAYHDRFVEGSYNVAFEGRVEPTYEEVGYSGDLVCAHCGEVLAEGHELEVLGRYAQLDFSSGTPIYKAVKSITTIDDKTSLTPVAIPGTEYYGLKLAAHNSGLKLALNEFDGFDLDAINNGQELAISVEYYIPRETSATTRILFDAQNGANKMMALYTNYAGTTWDAVALNGDVAMAREQLNVVTFTVGRDVNYVTGAKGQFGAGNAFETPQTVNTLEFAQDLISGGTILLRGWGVDPAVADDPSTEANEAKAESAVYIKSITVYDAADSRKQEVDTSMEFIDYTTEFKESPVYYPQYVKVGSSYGIAGQQVTEQGSVADGTDVTYVYYAVTHALKEEGKDTSPVVIRFTFKEGVEREEFSFAYQTTAPWQYLTLEIVDGVAEAVLEDATFTNGLNGKASFRLANYSTDPLVDDIARIEVYKIKDKTALNEALADSAELVKFKTPASVEAYNAIADEAKATAADPWATEEEIAAAVAALEEAAALLVDCDHACGTERIGYVAETCLTDGYSGDAACIDCGFVDEADKGETIPAHETRIINKKDASCKEAGNTGDLWCDVCQKIAKPGNAISKLPHSWDEGKVTKEATATEYGEFTKTCTGCGETLVTRLEFTAQLGDVDGNGKIDSTDARLILQFAVKKIDPTSLNLDVADVDGNGKVDSTDARLVLQYAVKKIDKLPAAK